jgi:phage repressor protein C with HTH and peptisase S24 domain
MSVEVAQRVRELIENSGIKQIELVKYLQVNQGTFGKWISLKETTNRKIPNDYIREIARYFKVSTDWILYGEDSGYKKPPNSINAVSNIEYATNNYFEMKIYKGAVGAGSMGEIDDSFMETTLLPKRILPNDLIMESNNKVMFEVVGDSMTPTIKENDWVIIDMVNGREFYEIDGIYLCNIDSTYQIKRLQFKGTKGVDIISDNKNYNIINSQECDLFEIVGKLHTTINIGSGLALK